MELNQAIISQRRFFGTGKTKGYVFRRRALLKLREALDFYEPQILHALKEDLHKSASEAYMAELGLVKSELSYVLSHLKSWMRPVKVKTPLSHYPARSFSIWEPYGVALVMAPWNYPLLLCLEPLIGAVAAGNCVVLKPSAYAPATASILAKIIGRLYPPYYIMAVEGGRKENEALLEQHFDKIFFTGGKEVGRLVLQKAARYLTPVTLELGGKSPCIIDETANLTAAARRVAFGKLLNAGQTCVAPDYLVVHEAVKDRLIKCLKKEFQKMAGTKPFENPNYPRIVNEKHYKRLLRLIQNEEILYGGCGNRESLQITPTILDKVTSCSPVMKEEIFGPVLPILVFRNKRELAEIIRHFEKPLACYAFTKNPQMKRWILKNISFGGGCINDTVVHLATPYLGFGGVGESGMGAYHGKAGFMEFSHSKGIVEKSLHPDFPFRYQPYRNWKDAFIRRIL